MKWFALLAASVLLFSCDVNVTTPALAGSEPPSNTQSLGSAAPGAAPTPTVLYENYDRNIGTITYLALMCMKQGEVQNHCYGEAFKCAKALKINDANGIVRCARIARGDEVALEEQQ